MVYPIDFNPAPARVMHIDLNSCFASVEQQANPLLRDKPVAVVASNAPYGCILAPSIEAKLWGVKTGMSLAEGRALCPWLIPRQADPHKYREVHAKLSKLLDEYSPHVVSKSIDEFCLSLPRESDPAEVSMEIKSRIKSEIGDYLRVSIGVSTNQILAKLASSLHKPDGFDTIDKNNYREIYGRVNLQDFCGINRRNEARLYRVNIFTATQFYEASVQTLKSAFESVLGRYWHARLRGYETDDIEFSRQSFGQSYVLPRPMDIEEWRPILAKLIAKASRRLRRSGYQARGVHLALHYQDHTSWHQGHKQGESMITDADLLRAALSLYALAPHKPVKKIAVTCYSLARDNGQLSCLVNKIRVKSLTQALDTLNDKWGEYAVAQGSLIGSRGHVRDAIAFGK